MALRAVWEGHKFGETPRGIGANGTTLAPLPHALQQQIRRGYMAAVAFVDFEVGRVLDALDTMSLTANTAVLLHGDHGWKLGEVSGGPWVPITNQSIHHFDCSYLGSCYMTLYRHRWSDSGLLVYVSPPAIVHACPAAAQHGDYSKCTNWEVDSRVPLIIKAPWIKASVGKRTMQVRATACDHPRTMRRLTLELLLPWIVLLTTCSLARSGNQRPHSTEPLRSGANCCMLCVRQHTQQFAELVDIFPTLCELAGLPLPPPSTNPEATGLAAAGLDGVSLVPIMLAPDTAVVKDMSFSQFPRCPGYGLFTDPYAWECLLVPRQNISVMGYSVRVANARYTEWRKWTPSLVADWGGVGLLAKELYDHSGDTGFGAAAFDEHEYDNLAYVEAHSDLAARLAAVLRKQFDVPALTSAAELVVLEPPSHIGE